MGDKRDSIILALKTFDERVQEMENTTLAIYNEMKIIREIISKKLKNI